MEASICSSTMLRISFILLTSLGLALSSSCSGSTYTNERYYSLSCGQDLPGADMDISFRVHADDFSSCVDYCTSMDAFCAAVSYEASEEHGEKNCYPKTSKPAPVKQSFPVDSAISLDNAISSVSCDNSPVSSNGGGKTFEKKCGFDIPGSDLKQTHADSLFDCTKTCLGEQDCVAVSWEGSMAHGYQNCYLKRGALGQPKEQDFPIDSAIMRTQGGGSGAGNPPSDSSGSSAVDSVTVTVTMSQSSTGAGSQSSTSSDGSASVSVVTVTAQPSSSASSSSPAAPNGANRGGIGTDTTGLKIACAWAVAAVVGVVLQLA